MPFSLDEVAIFHEQIRVTLSRNGSMCGTTDRVQDGATILGVSGLSNAPEGHPTLLEKPRPLSPVYYDDILGLKRMTRSLFRGQR
jgi:hypothetical protein